MTELVSAHPRQLWSNPRGQFSGAAALWEISMIAAHHASGTTTSVQPVLQRVADGAKTAPAYWRAAAQALTELPPKEQSPAEQRAFAAVFDAISSGLRRAPCASPQP